jgi:hypothetical protein
MLREIEDMKWFREKLFKSLGIPKEYLETNNKEDRNEVKQI